MSNTHTRTAAFPEGFHLLKCTATGFLVMGILTITLSSASLLTANLTGGGSTVLHLAQANDALVDLHAGPPLEAGAAQSDIELQLVIGMLLVLAGLGFHALCVLQAAARKPRRTQQRKQSKLVQSLHRVFNVRLV